MEFLKVIHTDYVYGWLAEDVAIRVFGLWRRDIEKKGVFLRQCGAHLCFRQQAMLV